MSEKPVLNTEVGERKKGVKLSVLNTVLNTSRIVKSFSVKPDDCNTLAAFIEISRREDPDFSTTVVKAMREYVQRHAVPNPQARLDRLLEIGLPHKPSWQCCVPGCEAKAQFQLILRDFDSKTELFQVCKKHKRWTHSRFKFLVGWKDI